MRSDYQWRAERARDAADVTGGEALGDEEGRRSKRNSVKEKERSREWNK